MFPATRSASAISALFFRCPNFCIPIKVASATASATVSSNYNNFKQFHTDAPFYAARKGTRARKEKSKVKKEVVVRRFLRLRLKGDPNVVYVKQRPFSKAHYDQPIDDVYFYRKFDTKQWGFREAIQNHREILHPTVYNKPNAPVILRIDVDLKYPNRPQKCQDKWRMIVEMPHPFQFVGIEPPTILAFCPNDPNLITQVLQAGANVAGGAEIIKSIQSGEIATNDFEYVIAHPLMLPEITPLRGLMKKNFPTSKNKTIGTDLPGLVVKLKNGLKLALESSDHEPDYGYIETPIGNLDMDIDGLEANFEAILRDTLAKRIAGKQANEFILQCLLKTPESFEVFKIDIQEAILRLDKKPTKPQIEQQAEEAEVLEDDEVVEKKVAQ